MLNDPHPRRVGTTCFSRVPREFPSAILVAFRPETPSKSVGRAVGVTRKTQLKSHAQCSPKR